MQGWPVHKEGFDIKNGQEVRVTADKKAEASSLVLPIRYPHFAHMCQPGDTLFVGRYLVNGADQSSLYLEVQYDHMTAWSPHRLVWIVPLSQALLRRVSCLAMSCGAAFWGTTCHI